MTIVPKVTLLALAQHIFVTIVPVSVILHVPFVINLTFLLHEGLGSHFVLLFCFKCQLYAYSEF